jgi:hypothetical protein
MVRTVTVYDGDDKPIVVPYTGDWRDSIFENRWACIPCAECPDEHGYLCGDCTDWTMVLCQMDRDYRVEEVARRLVKVAAPPVSPVRLALALPTLCDALGIDPIAAAEKATADEEASRIRAAKR